MVSDWLGHQTSWLAVTCHMLLFPSIDLESVAMYFRQAVDVLLLA